ncbi:(2Fe-2S)-binding protein [Streptomyces sp. NPDC004609]|uniref:(2Fe-2S)-binding protein n=1 Tax=Streptomyces sp. NPDC004609 TaxID=3364704 RepID=UPI00368E4C5C
MDLLELGAIGGFFALRTGDGSSTGGPGGEYRPGGSDTSATWHGLPLARLYAGADGPLAVRVDTVAVRLRAPERRVAASIAQLGLAARLWSVALGSAALYGELPDLDPQRLHWAPDRSSPDDLRLTRLRTVPAGAGAIRDMVQYGHLAPLADAFRRDTRISPRLLWGNAGSALAAAVREIDRWARGAGRPEVGERAAALAAELFGHPDLSGTVHGPGHRRTSCCLYYRAGGGLCGDCVFDRPPGAPAP